VKYCPKQNTTVRRHDSTKGCVDRKAVLKNILPTMVSVIVLEDDFPGEGPLGSLSPPAAGGMPTATGRAASMPTVTQSSKR